MTEQSGEGSQPKYEAFQAQLAARVPGKATCVEAWPRDANGERVLVGLAEGTLLILAPVDNGAQSPNGIDGSNSSRSLRAGSSLSHADSSTGSALGGGVQTLCSLSNHCLLEHIIPHPYLT